MGFSHNCSLQLRTLEFSLPFHTLLWSEVPSDLILISVVFLICLSAGKVCQFFLLLEESDKPVLLYYIAHAWDMRTEGKNSAQPPWTTVD